MLHKLIFLLALFSILTFQLAAEDGRADDDAAPVTTVLSTGSDEVTEQLPLEPGMHTDLPAYGSLVFPWIEEDFNASRRVFVLCSNRCVGEVMWDGIRETLCDGMDFTYAAFGPNAHVTTVDLKPTTEGFVLPDNHKHFQRDLKTLPFSGMLDMVMLEWVPPLLPEDLGFNGNVKRVFMIQAIEKAHAMLKTGGRLIIDNFPFFTFYSSLNKRDLVPIASVTPFTFHVGKDELAIIHSELRKFFGVGTSTESVHPWIQQAISQTEIAFSNDLAGLRSWSVEDELDLTFFDKRDVTPQIPFFFAAYHAVSRFELMGNILRFCGFPDPKMYFCAENPWNKRKFAFVWECVKKEVEALPDPSEPKETRLIQVEEM